MIYYVYIYIYVCVCVSARVIKFMVCIVYLSTRSWKRRSARMLNT